SSAFLFSLATHTRSWLKCHDVNWLRVQDVLFRTNRSGRTRPGAARSDALQPQPRSDRLQYKPPFWSVTSSPQQSSAGEHQLRARCRGERARLRFRRVSTMRQMSLVAFLQAQNCTNLPCSWRHPQSRTDAWSADYYRRIGRVLEEGKFHLGFFDDRLSMPDIYGHDHAHTVQYGIRCVKMD